MNSQQATGGDIRVKTSQGETYIAATQRPDGTWRKARRVKANYVPQDEQPKFQCKAQQELLEKAAGSSLKYPVGWAPIEATKPSSSSPSTSSPSSANKASQANKKQGGLAAKPIAHIEKPNAPITPQDHLAKKISGLRKKLDEIDKLKARIASGNLAKPEKTQLQKIERREQIEEEIEALTNQMHEL